jgi:hypothetical protein
MRVVSHLLFLLLNQHLTTTLQLFLHNAVLWDASRHAYSDERGRVWRDNELEDV